MSSDRNQRSVSRKPRAAAVLLLVDAVEHRAAVKRPEADTERLIDAADAESSGATHVIQIDVRACACIVVPLPITGSDVVHDVSPWSPKMGTSHIGPMKPVATEIGKWSDFAQQRAEVAHCASQTENRRDAEAQRQA